MGHHKRDCNCRRSNSEGWSASTYSPRAISVHYLGHGRLPCPALLGCLCFPSRVAHNLHVGSTTPCWALNRIGSAAARPGRRCHCPSGRISRPSQGSPSGLRRSGVTGGRVDCPNGIAFTNADAQRTEWRESGDGQLTDRRLTSYLEKAGGAALLTAEPGLVRMLAGHAADVASGPSPFQLPAAVLAPGDGPSRLICSVDEAPEGDWVHTYEGFTAGPTDPVSGAGEAFRQALESAGLQKARVVVDMATVPASLASGISGRPAAAPALGALGAVKTDAEVTAIEESVRLCDVGQAAAREATVAGATELDLWAHVTAAIERHAGQRVTIVAALVCGPRTAGVGGPPSSRP